MWAIYYRESIHTGETLEDWLSAPDQGVQAVVVYAPYPDGRRPWAGVDDRQLWTGDDEFSINGWPEKRGLLIPDAEYFAIWERACAS